MLDLRYKPALRFLGQFAGWIFYPPSRFSSERIEIEGDIGDRE
jgi:hypothetical protein